MADRRSRNLRSNLLLCLKRTVAMNTFRRSWGAAAGVVAVTAMVAGCSSLGGLTGGDAPAAPPAPASSDGSFTSRVTAFFSGDSAKLKPSGSPSTTGAASTGIECPSVEYRLGAATWTVNGPTTTENGALGVRYQGSFIQAARECIPTGANLTIKVGVQGRVVVGPAGTAGTINVPLRYALVREGIHPQTVWTKLFMVPVTIPPGELNLTWLHVEEEMTVPRPPAQDIDAYVIYVGFDPDGTAKSKPAAKPKAARAR
jgi:hypothetical protein